MRMRELVGYKVPNAVVELWEAGEGDTLLPLQELAVRRHGLFGEGNLLVQAPTSSGKTFIGEMAAIQTALRGKKVVYLAPLKALAEEKYRDFHAKYSDYGLKVVISTRDHREHDRLLEEGRFSVAVMVYEKLAQLLVRKPERLAEVDLVIADELELLSDPERGAMTELLLARLLHGGRRIIGLSAVIGHPDRLAKWMRAQLVFYERRPIELRYGVLHEGVFRYRTYNDYGQGQERLADADSESPWEIVTQNLAEFVGRGESCLVFVKAKHESRRGASLLAARINLPDATQAIEALNALEPTRSRDALIRTLSSGIAFHNADLSPEERRIVEQAFRCGEALAMVSTGTLAVGLNLPAQNVFISPEKWRYDERLDIPWKTPVLHHEYENMGGRAGRYGAGCEFGRSILIASSPFDLETLWRRYIDGEREPIEPRLAHAPLDTHVLRMVASRDCRTVEAVTLFLESTLTGKWIWNEHYTRDEISFRVRTAVNRCIELEMMREDGAGQLIPTGLGLAVSGKGISIETARQLVSWIQASNRRDWHPIDFIIAAAMMPDGRLLQVMLTSREYEQGGYLDLLKRATSDLDIDPITPMNRLRHASVTPFFDEVRAIKGALFLDAWINETSIQDIEEEYHTMAGQVLAAANQISWLVDAASAVAATVGASSKLIEQLDTLSARLQYGVYDDLLPLARLEAEGLTRSTLLWLRGEGVADPAVLAMCPQAVLEERMPRDAARALMRWAGAQPVDTPALAPVVAASVALPPRPRTVLVIDDARPGEVLLDGECIALQDKQYRLLRILAEQAGACVPYDEVYEALWGDVIVEQGQLYSQKRNLLKRLAAVRPAYAEVIATRPKHGFTLNLQPEQVLLKRARLATAAA
jgi:helicase